MYPICTPVVKNVDAIIQNQSDQSVIWALHQKGVPTSRAAVAASKTPSRHGLSEAVTSDDPIHPHPGPIPPVFGDLLVK